METDRYTDRKSRLVFQEADGRMVEWRSIGSITILGPGLKRPLELHGGYLIIFKDPSNGEDLRKAVIVVEHWAKTWASRLYWALLVFVLGVGLGRLIQSLL